MCLAISLKGKMPFGFSSMGNKYLNILFFAIAGLLFKPAVAQCDFTINPNPACGSSPVVLTVINPDSSKDYNFRFGGTIPRADGEQVTVVFPGAATQQTYSISLFDGNQLCRTTPPSRKTITVQSAPDASGLTDISGNTTKPFTLCTSTTANPNFNLTVKNESATIDQNTSYTIDWGDGSPIANFGSNFNTASHTYTNQGYFTLTFTVNSSGLQCNSSTQTYSIFNGNIPAGGISSFGSTIGGCAPRSYVFNLENILNNSAGTEYKLYVNKTLTNTYSHPPPAQALVTFEDHSCGLTGPNGFPNSHLLELEISNQCFTYRVPTSPIVLSSPPLANFKYDVNLCVGKPVTFINTTLGATYNSDGTCSTVKDPSWEITPDTGWTLLSGCLDNGCDTIRVEFHSPGPWEVEMFIDNPCGEDSITKVLTLQIKPDAKANATINNPLGCAPLEAYFTNLSIAENPTWQWSVTPAGSHVFINGTNSGSKDPQIRFTQPGSYLVRLTIPSAACGNSIWDTTIVVKGVPRPNIATIPDQCDIFTYTPTANINTSNSPLIDVEWQFPGGTPSSYIGLGTPPDVNYSNAGTYIVTLLASNACGTGTDRDTFSILSTGPPSIGNDSILCDIADPVKLIANPSGGVWFGTGVVNDTFFPAIAGVGPHIITYNLALSACTRTATKTFTVQAKPVADAGDTLKVCSNSPPIPIPGASPLGGRWEGPGVINPIGIFDPQGLNPGRYLINYIYASPVQGCADTAEKVVVVNPLAIFSVVDTPQLCLGKGYFLSDFLDSTAIIRTGAWDFGDGNTSIDPSGYHLYTAPGLYQVIFDGVTDAGCRAVSSTWVRVLQAPQLSFTKTPDGACFGANITFTPTASLTVKYQWNFGLGYTDTSSNPLPVYFGQGKFFDTTYYITLTGYFACDTIIVRDSVTIRRAPVANFGTPTNTGCTPFIVTLFNNTTGSPDSYFWDFGNGNTSILPNPPPPTYLNSGITDITYTITLAVSNSCGVDTIRKNIIVKPKDVTARMGVNPLSGCVPLNVRMESFSTPGAFVIWDLGNGLTAVGDTVQYTYNTPGTYDIQLIARTACSADTSVTTIQVYPRPEISFSVAPENCAGKTVSFNNTSVGASAFWWEYGNGFVSTIQSPTYAYPQAGAYTVKLSGQNTPGCRDTVSKNIQVYPQPEAAFSVITDPTCDGTPLEFANFSTDADRFFWDFGDGTTSVDAFPVKTYNNAGIYNITLIASKNNFCFDTLMWLSAVDILPTPVVNFDYEMLTGLESGTVLFTNYSTDAASYLWGFGDGAQSTLVNPSHTYASGGKYRVNLLGISTEGCRDSTSKIIEIKYAGEVFVPNAFAPLSAVGTEAGLFKPKGFGLRSYLVEVFSTYGELLWSSSLLENGQPVEGWDGTFKGQLMPQDTYVWKITAITKDGSSWAGAPDPDGKRRNMGVVLLLR
jgi:PKD repeat protein